MFTESMMPINHLILRRPITFLFTWNEGALRENKTPSSAHQHCYLQEKREEEAILLGRERVYFRFSLLATPSSTYFMA